MKRKILFVQFVLCMIAMLQICNAQSTTSITGTSFYGLHVNRGGAVLNGTEPWPGTGTSTQSFKSLRTLNFTDSLAGGCVHWYCMNPSENQYLFQTTTSCTSRQDTLDDAICDANANGQDVLYTTFGTPSWAQGSSCSGIACPPADVDNGGGGADLYYSNYVTALAKHVVNLYGVGVVKYWEPWNEINYKTINKQGQYIGGWAGSSNQLVRMACDANVIVKSYDPNAMIVSPPASDGSTESVQDFLTASIPPGHGPTTCSLSTQGCRGIDCVDVIGTHGYIDGSNNGYGCASGSGNCPVPEDAQTVLNNIRTLMSNLGITKPLFITEDGWGAGQLAQVAVEHASWISRTMLMFTGGTSSSNPPDKVYVYGFDFAGTHGQGPENFDGTTTLWDYWDTTQTGPTSAGTAYSQIQNWINGNSIGNCGLVSGTVSTWTCDLNPGTTKPQRIVWDANMSSCFKGFDCPSSPYYFPQGEFTKYQTLLGGGGSITSNNVPITAEPLLLLP